MNHIYLLTFHKSEGIDNSLPSDTIEIQSISLRHGNIISFKINAYKRLKEENRQTNGQT